MDKSHLARFEEISHVLIEEGFGDMYVKAKIITSLSFLDKLQLFFEKKVPLPHRMLATADRLGPTFVNFSKYLATRTDILPHHITDSLKKAKLPKTYTLPKPRGKFTKVDLSAHRFDGFSYVATAIKSKRPVVIHYITDQLAKNYKIDMEILFFIAQKLDETYSLSFSARRLVHGYQTYVHEKLNLETNAKFAGIYSGALKSKSAIPTYVSKDKSMLVVKRAKGIPCSDMPAALLKYHHVHDSMLDNINRVLIKPVFTHGFLLTKLTMDNIVVQDKGAIHLNHIPSMEKLSKHEVGELSLLLSSVLTNNVDAIVQQLCPAHIRGIARSRLVLTRSPTAKHAKQMLEELHKLDCRVPKYFFDFVSLATMAEEIGYAFTAQRDLLVRLKPLVEEHLKLLAKEDLKKSKLEHAQKYLDEKSLIDTQIDKLETSVFPRFTFSSEFIAFITMLGAVLLLLVVVTNVALSAFSVIVTLCVVFAILGLLHKIHVI